MSNEKLDGGKFHFETKAKSEQSVPPEFRDKLRALAEAIATEAGKPDSTVESISLRFCKPDGDPT